MILETRIKIIIFVYVSGFISSLIFEINKLKNSRINEVSVYTRIHFIRVRDTSSDIIPQWELDGFKSTAAIRFSVYGAVLYSVYANTAWRAKETDSNITEFQIDIYTFYSEYMNI